MKVTFVMVIFGADMQITGTYSPEQEETRDSPRWPAYFEIESVAHKGEELCFEDFGKGTLELIEEQGLDVALNTIREASEHE